MIEPGTLLTLDVEKPAAGGRMLGRHERQIVLVSQTIPGERVRARVERAVKGVVFAETVEVMSASPDRRSASDWRCGGNVLAHIGYQRQLRLKGEIVHDALARIGRIKMDGPPDVIPSPDRGYRMRARLHARDGQLGFYREGSHELCDAASTGQLLSSTTEWLRDVEARLQRHADPAARQGVRGLELSENVPGEQRAAWLDVREDVDASWFTELRGPDTVVDLVACPGGAGPLQLHRGARSFFQGNRFLLERMAHHVASLVPDGPVVDLYAGVGLFGLMLAARGSEVTLVEGDHASGHDLRTNAAPYAGRVHVQRTSVETFLAAATRQAGLTTATWIVDPPRTGLSKQTLAGLVRHRPGRIVYVSCDPATLARDARGLLDAGYQLGTVTGLDLFPNTAHVEVVMGFDA